MFPQTILQPFEIIAYESRSRSLFDQIVYAPIVQLDKLEAYLNFSVQISDSWLDESLFYSTQLEPNQYNSSPSYNVTIIPPYLFEYSNETKNLQPMNTIANFNDTQISTSNTTRHLNEEQVPYFLFCIRHPHH